MRWGALAIVASLDPDRHSSCSRWSFAAAPMWSLVAVGVAFEPLVGVAGRNGRASPRRRILILDVVLADGPSCTLSGGPTNPFSIHLRRLHRHVRGHAVSTRWTWAIAGLSVVSFAALVRVPRAERTPRARGSHRRVSSAPLWNVHRARPGRRVDHVLRQSAFPRATTPRTCARRGGGADAPLGETRLDRDPGSGRRTRARNAARYDRRRNQGDGASSIEGWPGG